MNKHSEIRKAVISRLKEVIGDRQVHYFDGRPVFLEPGDLPALAVYISDAQYTGGCLDADSWEAVLHIEVFLKSTQPDSALDEWIENVIYPALISVPALSGLIETIIPQGYEYQRDIDMVTWGSADITYHLSYEM